MLSASSTIPVPAISTRDFIQRNSAFKKFYKTQKVLHQLSACNNLGPLGIPILKEKEKIIFQQISVTAVALLRFLRDTSSGATDKIVLEKPLPPLETNAAAVHPYLNSTGMTHEKYLNIANNYLAPHELTNFIEEQTAKSPILRLYAYRDYYREAYALFEYCEILLKILHDNLYANEADRYTSSLFNPIAIAEENIRIQDYVGQQIYTETQEFLATRSFEEKKSKVYEIPKDETYDLFTRFFNVEVISYKAEHNMQFSVSDPIDAFQMHCEAYTDILLSGLFLLKFIDFCAGGSLLKRKSPEGAATLTRYFSEYKIPEAEMIYDGSSNKNATMLSLNLLPGGTTQVITNKIKLTLKFDVIIIHLTKIIMTFESEERHEILQNLFEQAENILYSHSALYKEFFLEGIELNSKGNIIKPLDTIGTVTSGTRRLYSATPKPITMSVDPDKLNLRINHLKSNTVFMEFFNIQFVLAEFMSLVTLPREEAINKEKLIYSNIMLGAAYLLRHLSQVTHGDITKVFSYPPPAIFKFWEDQPDLADKIAYVMINIPVLEYQIENNKRDSTYLMLLKLRDYYRGAYTLCQYTEILLRQFKGQTRENELEEFTSRRIILNELREQNKKIEMIARQRDTQNRKGKKNKEIYNAYKEHEMVVTTQINVVTDFFNKNKMHKAVDNALDDRITNPNSDSTLQAEIYTTSILASLFIMKFLNHLSGNTILNTFYKTKEEETLFYFSAYRIPDASFDPKAGGNPSLAIVAKPSETKTVHIIISALNINNITTEIARILKFAKVETRNIEFKSLYDQAVKMFHNFDLHYKSKHIFIDIDARADDSILKPIHFQPVLTLSSFPIPEFPEEKKKAKKAAKSEAKTTRRVSEDKPQDKTKKQEIPDPKVLSDIEIVKDAARVFAHTARKRHADIPAFLLSAQTYFAELRRRNAKIITPENLNISDDKLFKEISDVKSLVLGIGESIDSLSAQHADFVIPEITTSELLAEAASNRDVLKQACADCEKLFNDGRSLATTVSSLEDRINKITQKLQHQEASRFMLSTNTASIKQKLQNKHDLKEAEKKAAAERKKKLEEEKKAKEPKKKSAPPPMTAVAGSSAKSIKLFSATSSKEQKHSLTSKEQNYALAANPIREIRATYMDEACQSLIFINKIFEHYCGLDSDVMHFSLLYNIFRCFLALKTYQECGGRQSEELNVDTIKELRHMIIHHGGRAVDNMQVLSFAEDIRKRIPSALLNLKKPHQWKSELNASQCNKLMEEFGLMPSGIEKLRNPDPFSKVIDDTPFYKQLRQFHEAKIDNEVGLEDQELVLTIYIPLMKSIIASFQKQPDYKTNVNLFLQSYLFELQALCMLATLCGELSMGFPLLDYKLTNFLSECYLIRNEVGHEIYDLDKLTFFAEKIERKLSHVKLQKITDTKTEEPKTLYSAPRA